MASFCKLTQHAVVLSMWFIKLKIDLLLDSLVFWSVPLFISGCMIVITSLRVCCLRDPWFWFSIVAGLWLYKIISDIVSIACGSLGVLSSCLYDCWLHTRNPREQVSWRMFQSIFHGHIENFSIMVSNVVGMLIKRSDWRAGSYLVLGGWMLLRFSMDPFASIFPKLV